MKGTLPWVAAFFAFTLSGTHAQTVPSPSVQACLSCHGMKTDTGALPNFQAMDSATIAAGLAEFRAGTRHGTIMNRIAKGYSEAESRMIADEIVAVARGTKP